MKMKLLAIDDEPSILRILSLTLKEHFDVTTASSAVEGLKLMEEVSFDIILTDEQMPEMNGSEMIKLLRKRGDRIPCVLLTGFLPPIEARKQHLNQDLVFIFRKPWEAQELIDALSEACWMSKIKDA